MQEISSALAATMPARFHVGAGSSDDGVGLDHLLADNQRLREWIDAEAELVGAPNRQVAASLLVQHTATVLGGSMLAAGSLHGSLPIATPEAVMVAPGVGAGPSSPRWRFFVSPHGFEHGSPDALLVRWAEIWVEGVLIPLVDAVHASVRVGKRMLVDNVASAAAANLVFLDWWEPEAGFDRLASTLSRIGNPRFGESMEFSTINHGGRDGLCSARRSCCLHFRCEPAHWCPSCPKLVEAERERIMRTHLGHLDAVVANRN